MVARYLSLYFLSLLLISTPSDLFGQRHAPSLSKSEIEKLVHRAGKGDIASQIKLGVSYQYGKVVTRDLATAERWLKRAAGSGMPEAQTQLGLLYLSPEFVKRRAGEAKVWFMRAAACQFARAEYNLGLMYKGGIGTEVSNAEAERWFRKAAKHGLEVANLMLAMLLVDSEDREKQHAGLELLEAKADRGSAEAQNLIGYCYESGRGTEKQDIPEAVAWYRKSAKAGDQNAMSNLGRLYYFGDGVSKNVEAASDWFRKACQAGNARACGDLAQLNVRGEIQQDEVETVYALAMIARRDVVVNILEPRLTEEQRRIAAGIAQNWSREHPIDFGGQFAWESAPGDASASGM